MRDSLYIGEVPCNEECEQLGPNYDPKRARKECEVFIDLIRRTLGEEQGGARLYIKSNPHDFGTYLSVECRYDDNDEEGVEYAFLCESDAPQDWDDIARKELGL